jgi:hypothetical protein
MSLVLDKRHRSRLVISGALLGALIGPLGLWLDLRPKLGPDVRSRFGSASEVIGRWANAVWSLEAGWVGLLVLGVPFLATLILMPWFLRWLEARGDGNRAPFYFQAALAGLAFGAGATALIAWGLMIAALIAGSVTGAGNLTPAQSTAALVGGSLIFAPLMGLAAPFLFIPSIVGLGIPFGLLFGALVRRFARDGGDSRGSTTAAAV